MGRPRGLECKGQGHKLGVQPSPQNQTLWTWFPDIPSRTVRKARDPTEWQLVLRTQSLLTGSSEAPWRDSAPGPARGQGLLTGASCHRPCPVMPPFMAPGEGV